jgi:diguanylate cyclase (GGDEF)-like protein
MPKTWHSLAYKQLKQFLQNITFGVSLGFRIYFASFLIFFVTSGSIAVLYLYQQNLAYKNKEILNIRISSMEAAQKIKESMVAYDNNVFRFVATKSDFDLNKARNLKREALLELDRLNTLTNNSTIKSRLVQLRSRLQNYFLESNELIEFAKTNVNPPSLNLFQVASWARTQGLQKQELSALSAAGSVRLESVFAICDELLTYNQARLAEAKISIDQSLADSRRWGKLMMLVSSGLVLLVAMALAISLVGPIRILMDGVKKVESGSPHIELPITTSTEIGQLTAAFNRMARTISAQRERLLQETITDELTGIYNKRYFTRRIKEEFERSQRTNEPLSVMMIDLDHFKGYNDTMGHELGNVVLKKVSGIIAENLRNVDLLFRYGGDEFVAILPDQEPSEAGRIAARLVESVQSCQFPGETNQKLKKLTLSIGGASFPHNAQGLSDLIEKADGALYQTKRDGRNGFSWCGNQVEKLQPAWPENQA